jgi:hypothetical protein
VSRYLTLTEYALAIGLLAVLFVDSPQARELAATEPRPRVKVSAAFYDSRCGDAYRGVRWYRARYDELRHELGQPVAPPVEQAADCRRLRERARYWRHAIRANQRALERHRAYHWDWPSWLPDKWQRVGACETGYGKRPGRWDWNSGTYQGAFGFYHGSWDAFVPHADPKAGPYPSGAYLATPRQQYEVALAIWRRFGFSGWGCRNA